VARAIHIGWPGLIGKGLCVFLGYSHLSVIGQFGIMESTRPLMYTSDFPLKNFFKLAKQAKVIIRRNYQKQGFGMITHCLGNSKIILIPE